MNQVNQWIYSWSSLEKNFQVHFESWYKMRMRMMKLSCRNWWWMIINRLSMEKLIDAQGIGLKLIRGKENLTKWFKYWSLIGRWSWWWLSWLRWKWRGSILMKIMMIIYVKVPRVTWISRFPLNYMRKHHN